MSDSEDDWFTKDVDEMVQDVQKKTENLHTSADINSAETSEHPTSNRIFLFDQDYGGGYNYRTAGSQTMNNSTNKGKGKSGELYTQKMSVKRLKFISQLEPIEAFLEVYQVNSGFFECFKETVSSDHARLILVILGKMCELPFEEYARDFLGKFVNSSNILEQVRKYFDGDNYPTTVYQQFVEICWKAESFGLKNETLLSMLRTIQTFQKSGSGLKNEIEKVMQAFQRPRENQKEIYPTLEELISNEPDEVKPNIIKGKYSSTDEYIATHLSLLREDFVAPLREFICELKRLESIDQASSNRLYKTTRFRIANISKSNSTKGATLLVDLKPTERKKEEAMKSDSPPWVNPKKLMYGTLLCFTTSLQFSDLILAVVTHRDLETLTKGYIYVEIIKMYNVLNIFEHDFIMFENEVFFEPYHHVYQVLRGLHERNFPLANYLVQVESNTHPPNYLKGSSKFYYKHRNYTFDPLDSKSYPTPSALNLDESQHAALQQSLSKKFSLIQGPPGTGKTFIGLKVVSTLLENVDSRILVVCYTNHALDQFLSGILEFTTDIVRCGSQSKHALLDNYNIRQLPESAVNSQKLKSCHYHTKSNYSKLMHEFNSLQTKGEGVGQKENYQKIIKLQEDLRRESAKLDELKQIFEFHTIRSRKVIGMTTTYASRKNILLQLLKTPIVVVEEAAEVLESHIVAALTKSTEHVILIGDHQQLRPTTSVYRLSEKFKMDISLFERMINNNLNCVCLNKQYRMRPEIANLLRPTIYKDLNDADNVRLYEDVRGIRKNMFFINHDIKETKATDETTKRNPHEVRFLLSLADYLITQNYKPADIVILSTYNGQMFDFLNERRNYPRLEKVRITVVDNFQGEESKIILLSLVRNNNDKRIGYLAMKNRICVALSRAQVGFYVIGAIDFLARNNTTWSNIKAILEKQEMIGDSLELMCKEHESVTKVTSSKDFEFMTSRKCCVG